MAHIGKISVIVPVYKAEAWLARCVDSILAQTFRDLEVILVDGEWVAFVDSDDWLEPDYLERLADRLTGPDCDVVMGGARITDGVSITGRTCPPRQTLTKEELLDRFWDFFDMGILMSSSCCKLYRRTKISQPFSAEMRCGEDTRFNMDFLKGAEQIALADTDGYCCFVPANASGTTKYPQRNVREFSLYIGGVGELLAQAPPEGRDPERYDAFVFRSMCGDMKWISLSRTLDEAKAELARYLALPDVRQALAHRAWRGMALPFRLLGLLLRVRLTGAAVRCCKWGRG